MKKQESYIKNALEVLREPNKVVEKNTIKKQYKGYISSMGASIVTTGLLPTICMYSDATANSEEDKTFLVSILYNLIKKNRATRKLAIPSQPDLKSYIENSNESIQQLKEETWDAALALKYAMRTYKMV